MWLLAAGAVTTAWLNLMDLGMTLSAKKVSAICCWSAATAAVIGFTLNS